MPSFWDTLFGTSPKVEQYSTLNPKQQQLFSQLMQALSGKGAGGAFGDTADYYRDVLSNDSNTLNAMFSPEIRRFNQETIPGLAEQFAGMGAGGLESSGFRNATTQAGTDLAERLASLRAGLRGQATQGLTQLGNQGLQNFTGSYMEQPQPGLLTPFIQGAGNAFLGPLGTSLGALGQNLFGNMWNANSNKGKSGVYGNKSMNLGSTQSGFKLPSFLQG